VAEEALATEESNPDEAEDERAPSTRRWAIRGAVVGAVAGGAAGAGVGILVARRPEALSQAKSAIGDSGGQVARAAVVAATEVVTSRRLSQLMAGNGNGDHSRAIKETAREAGAAAAKAARESIIALRREESASD
jgi:L-aminopeptidase/D-esterase-like protein